MTHTTTEEFKFWLYELDEKELLESRDKIMEHIEAEKEMVRERAWKKATEVTSALHEYKCGEHVKLRKALGELLALLSPSKEIL